jgi:predicted transposase YbfD/YdcC
MSRRARRRCGAPSKQVDADALDRVVGGWLAEQQAQAPATGQPGAVAVDGKTLCGAVAADGQQVHLLAALAHSSATVLAQRRVDAKSNEITGFRPLLAPLDLEGKVVTADALHTQVEHARWLVEDKHADYLLTVKGNQPGLQTAIERLAPDAFPPAYHTVDRGHGRIEHRTIQTAPAPAGVRFPYAAQVLVLDRHTTDLAGHTLRPRSPTPSPVSPPPGRTLPGCLGWPAASGRSRTACTGFGM